MTTNHSGSGEGGEALANSASSGPGASLSRLMDLYALRWKLSKDLLEEEIKMGLSHTLSLGALGLGLAIILHTVWLTIVGLTVYAMYSAGWSVILIGLFLLLSHGLLATLCFYGVTRCLQQLDVRKQLEAWRNRLFQETSD